MPVPLPVFFGMFFLEERISAALMNIFVSGQGRDLHGGCDRFEWI